MANPIKIAKLKSTGEEIEVYRHKPTGNWISLDDCKTEYKPSELIM